MRDILYNLSRGDNGDNYVLIRSSKGKGFYKTDDLDEIAAYKKECENRGRNCFAPLTKINRILKGSDGQFEIFNNLRTVREALGLKQKAVCKKMKKFDAAFDVSLLSKMENGVCLPTFYQLAKLAEIYGVEQSELVGMDLLGVGFAVEI